MTKLTLRLDEDLIAAAKTWARAHGVSLSQAVAGFFAQLATGKPPALSPWTRRLAGAAARRGRTPTDEEIRREYAERVAEKHR